MNSDLPEISDKQCLLESFLLSLRDFKVKSETSPGLDLSKKYPDILCGNPVQSVLGLFSRIQLQRDCLTRLKIQYDCNREKKTLVINNEQMSLDFFMY